MVPSYYELFPVNPEISDLLQLDIALIHTAYQPLTTTEKGKILNPGQFSNSLPQYSIYKMRKENYLQATIPVVRKNESGEFEKLVSFTLRLNAKGSRKRASAYSASYKSASVLNSGKWLKIGVTQSGIYRITFAELVTYGIPNPANISVWGNGGRKLPYMNNEPSTDDLTQIPVFIEKGGDNVFNQGDYILFYVEGPTTWTWTPASNVFTSELHPYTKTTHYFLTSDVPNPITIKSETTSGLNPTHQVQYYDALVAFERNDTNLIKSGRDWFGESFDVYTTRSFDTKLATPQTGSQLKVQIRACARSASNSTFTLKANQLTLGTLYLPGINVGEDLADYVSVSEKLFAATIPTGNLTLSLTFSKPTASANGWLDYINVNARQQLKYDSQQLFFRDAESVGSGNISKFSVQNCTSSVQIWDISSIHNPIRINYTLEGANATFTARTDTLRQFVAFQPGDAYSPSLVGEVPNQNLHGLNQPDMVIVAHPDYLTHAQELAGIHAQNDGLTVAVVTPEQVYNEFSSGNPDVSAIRNLMRMLYQRATSEDELPQYLLLFGDGSYDNLSTRKANTNRIPTYQSKASINKTESFVSDDFFGLLDESEGEADGLLDIGIGRLPVHTVEQADAVLGKIKQYISQNALGDWQNQLCFVGDDEDSNIHMKDANTLADYVKANYPSYNVQKIFFDAYPQQTSSIGESYPDVTRAINTRVNNGVLLVNYTGHGNEQWLAHEKVLMLSDVQSWRNYQKLALFVTATCEFSRFDDFNLTSTGEWILLTPKGGGIGLISTTRLVYSNPNFTLNYNFIKTVFEKNSGKYYRLGDIIRITKNLSGAGYNKRNFMLLGDPALMLRYPAYEMHVTHVNGIPINEPLDTLKALSRVGITGRVNNPNGTLATDFNGIGSITVFDKENTLKTLQNNGNDVMNFTVRENTIYRGNVTITQGVFSANLFIPKDINYSYGSGKFSLFAENGLETAAGSNQEIVIGGINRNAAQDAEGPQVRIYLNDTKFVSGGISDPNPKLIIHLADSSGINTTGTGIGHDLTATLEGDEPSTFILNDFYQAEVDSYQKGRVEFQLTGLKPGPTRMRVKAWDTYNNSSTEEIEFTVQSDSKLSISHLLNYPNPFTGHTAFYFEHNQPYTDFEVMIQIYSPSGKLVKTIRHQEANTNGYRMGPIPWDGRDDFGDRIGRGVYFYRLRARTSSGGSAEQHQKLVILR